MELSTNSKVTVEYSTQILQVLSVLFDIITS